MKHLDGGIDACMVQVTPQSACPKKRGVLGIAMEDIGVFIRLTCLQASLHGSPTGRLRTCVVWLQEWWGHTDELGEGLPWLLWQVTSAA